MTRACLVALCLAPLVASADPILVEAGMSQRVPAGLSDPVPGALLRVALVSPLAGFDRSSIGVEAGVSDPAAPVSWLALELGLWRGFGGKDVVAPFVGGGLSLGFSRAPSGDAMFVGARLGAGVLVPTPGPRLVFGLWGVANEAGPGLSLTVGCLLPSDR